MSNFCDFLDIYNKNRENYESIKSNSFTFILSFKDGVIYLIDGSIGCDGKLGVSSVTESDKEVLIPSFTADGKTYYLDVLLGIGDKLDGDTLKHSNCDGTLTTLPEYYRSICIDEIDNEIRRNPQATFELYNNVPSSLGIPLYMLKGHGSVSGIEQINFTEAFFDEHKKRMFEGC